MSFRSINLSLIMFACWMFQVHAQNVSTFQNFLDAVEAKRAELHAEADIKRIDLRTRYAQALAVAEGSARKAGELESLLALRAELTAVTNPDPSTPLPEANALPESAMRMRLAYDKGASGIRTDAAREEIEFLRAIVSKLENLKRTLTQDDKIESAILASKAITQYTEVLEDLMSPSVSPVSLSGVSKATEPAPGQQANAVRTPLTPTQKAQIRELKKRLALHYGFDRKTDEVADLSKHEHTLSLESGAVVARGGKGVGALVLNGDGAFASLKAKPFDKFQPLTIALWVYGDDPGFETRFSRIIQKGDATGESRCFGITVDKGGGIITGFHQQANRNNILKGQYAASNTTRLENKTWYHVVMTFDGERKVRMYVNGEDDTSRVSGKTPWYTKGEGNQFYLGKMPGLESGDTFGGQLDEIMIWNEALDPEQIRLVYDSYGS